MNTPQEVTQPVRSHDMPVTSGTTPHRTFRVSDDVWTAAKARAQAEGTTVTAELVKFLTRYAKGGRK